MHTITQKVNNSITVSKLRACNFSPLAHSRTHNNNTLQNILVFIKFGCM